MIKAESRISNLQSFRLSVPVNVALHFVLCVVITLISFFRFRRVGGRLTFVVIVGMIGFAAFWGIFAWRSEWLSCGAGIYFLRVVRLRVVSSWAGHTILENRKAILAWQLTNQPTNQSINQLKEQLDFMVIYLQYRVQFRVSFIHELFPLKTWTQPLCTHDWSHL